jgi:nucleotide-binding universal stress UspA family protein
MVRSHLRNRCQTSEAKLSDSFRDIVVYLDASSYLEDRLDVAAALAKRHGANLIGVDITTQDAFEGQSRERAAEIGDRFEAVARARGVPYRYRFASREAASNLFVHSADLFVATQPNDESAHLAYAAVPEKTLLTGGVPGLILPCNRQKRDLGNHVLVAWNASREATRALHDALPILKKADRVVIFAFERHYDGKKTDMDALVTHLGNHGVKARVEPWTDTGDMDAVSALFACLDVDDIDLIVAGAYGHSRWIEGLFGGVSRDLIRQEDMAVLLSH